MDGVKSRVQSEVEATEEFWPEKDGILFNKNLCVNV